MILDSAVEAIGRTPLVRLDRIAKSQGLKCNLFGKLEFLSAGGSVKDRISKRMVEAAEQDGILIPGSSIVVEATSGNTGIGLALVCAVKGYPVIITLPEKMSLEKEETLRALGARVIRTPTGAPSESPDSNIGVAKRLCETLPNAVMLDQYKNANNPLAHEYTTGPEIIEDITNYTGPRPSSGLVDVFVAGAGTGGTITGVSRAIKKEHNSSAIMVGIDPEGSVLAQPSHLNEKKAGQSYVVEGIGYDFVPDALSREPGTVDHWVKTSDEDAFRWAKVLIQEEGLLIGGSSGSALAGAMGYLKSPVGWQECGGQEGRNAVIMLPDGIRNYMSKDWFKEIAREASAPNALDQAIAEALAERPQANGVAH